VNGAHRDPGQSPARVPVVSAAEGRAWRDAVDRILATWLLSGIDGAGLWKAVMASAPVGRAIRGVGDPSTPGGPPDAAGDADRADLRQGSAWAGAGAEVVKRPGAPGE
jgi:hypothetical protein